MKRIAEWFAAVGAAASKSGKRLVAVVGGRTEGWEQEWPP